MLIAEMTMPEFEAGLERTKTVLIPIGSTEEHGLHLPLDTDTLHATEVGRRLAERRPLFVAPPLHYGVCRSTADHPGTIGISALTLRVLILDLVGSFYRQGLRNVVLLSGHAGVTHMSAIVDAGEELLLRHDALRLAVLTEYSLASRAGREIIETPGDSHAGEIETSRILHSHPHLVKGSSAREFPDFPVGILVRDKRKYWPGGVWGDPAKASAEKGQRLEEVVLTALSELIDRLEAEVL